MTDFIIAYRVNDGQVTFVIDEDGDVAIFTSQKAADHYVEHNALFQSGQATYQVVELEI